MWTPPREADVPPVPWRKIAAVALVLAAAGAVAAAIAVPRIDQGKERGAVEERRDEARAKARERRRIERDQRLRRGRIRTPSDPLVDVEAAIGRDARERVRGGELKGPVRDVVCEPYTSGSVNRYACTAVREYVTTHGRRRGVLGYPFWAKVDRRRGTFAWCKVNPRPGERSVGDELVAVPPPRACNLRY